MPRDQIVIEGFNAGIIASPDAQDIPDDAASNSSDVDPETGDGVLRGRFADLAIASGPVSLRSAGFIERDTTEYDLIYHDEVANKIKYRQDFYGTPASGDLASVTDDSASCIVSLGQSVRVGLSNDQKVQFVGYIPDEQFGEEGNTTTLEIADAELVNPSGDPLFSKIVVYDNGPDEIAYCCDPGSTVLWRVNSTTKESESFGTFTSVQSICLSHNSATTLLVLDKAGSTYSIIPVDLTDDSVGAAHVISSFTAPTGATYTDIVAVDNGSGVDRVFLAAHFDTSQFPKSTAANRLVSVDISGTPVSITDRSPQVNDLGINPGNWIILKDGTTEVSFDDIFLEPLPQLSQGAGYTETFRTSLVKLSATKLGVVWRSPTIEATYVPDPGTGLATGYGPMYKTTASRVVASVVMAILNNTHTTTTLYPIAIFESQAFTPVQYTGISYHGGSQIVAFSYGDSIRRGQFSADPTAASVGDALTLIDVNTKDLPYSVTMAGLNTIPSPDIWMLARGEGFSGIDTIDFDFTVEDMTNFYEGGLVALDIENEGTGGNFIGERRYFYKTSIEYDGVQESPLSVTSWFVDNVLIGDLFNKQITVRVRTTDTTRRMTAINIYRAGGTITEGKAEEFYRHVVRIPLTIPYFAVESGTVQSARYYDANASGLGSYETRTGISETLDTNFVDYEIATLLNGMLFVGRARHEELTDAMHMIFRSRPFRWDAFNWADEHLRLPEIPTAMSSFNGRLFVFAQANVYRVDPESFVVEEIYPGAGCMGPRSVVRTDVGLFFADRENIYFIDGANLHHVGTAIRESLDGDIDMWKDATHEGGTPVAVYSSKLKQVHFFTIFSGGSIRSFAFHLPRKRWDKWLFDAVPGGETPTYPDSMGAITGKYGELYLATGDEFLEVSGDPDIRKGCLWKSKKFTVGTPSQDKKFYEIFHEVENLGALPTSTFLQFSVDDAPGEIVANGDKPVSNIRGKHCQVNITTFGEESASVGFDVVRNITVLFRRLAGLR